MLDFLKKKSGNKRRIIYNINMLESYAQILTRSKELQESKILFSSYLRSDNEFDARFSEMFGIDYKLVFGNQSKEAFIFKLLKNYYQNDFFVRYSFINKVLSKSKAISFEEFPIGESRIDLASINGKSIAYEIKTEFDNYKKLKRQINDYSKAFEYIYVICPKENIEKIKKEIPNFCGIYFYHGKTAAFFEMFKEASISPNLDQIVMLKLLRKTELLSFFKTDSIDDILELHSKECINDIFKMALKKRFKERWDKIKERAFCLK